MSVETASNISQLDASLPAAGDPKAEGDDHIRLIKSTVKVTFPNVAGAVNPTHGELNYLVGVTSAIQSQIDSKAPTASPTFTGTVTIPLGASIAGYAPLASPAFTGTPTAPTATAGTSTTQLATTAFVAATAFAPVLPGQTGNAGRLITTDGANASWVGIYGTENTISTSQTAVKFNSYVLTASLTLTLPASPSDGDWVAVVDRSGTGTCVIGRNGSNIMGMAEDMTLNSQNTAFILFFVDATRGWVLR